MASHANQTKRRAGILGGGKSTAAAVAEASATITPPPPRPATRSAVAARQVQQNHMRRMTRQGHAGLRKRRKIDFSELEEGVLDSLIELGQSLKPEDEEEDGEPVEAEVEDVMVMEDISEVKEERKKGENTRKAKEENDNEDDELAAYDSMQQQLEEPGEEWKDEIRSSPLSYSVAQQVTPTHSPSHDMADQAISGRKKSKYDETTEKVLQEMYDKIDEVTHADFDREKMKQKVRYWVVNEKKQLIDRIRKDGVDVRFCCKHCGAMKYLYSYETHSATSRGHRLTCIQCSNNKRKAKYIGDIRDKEEVQERLFKECDHTVLMRPTFRGELMKQKIALWIDDGRKQLIDKLLRDGLDLQIRCKNCGIDRFLYDYDHELDNATSKGLMCSYCRGDPLLHLPPAPTIAIAAPAAAPGLAPPPSSSSNMGVLESHSPPPPPHISSSGFDLFDGTPPPKFDRQRSPSPPHFMAGSSSGGASARKNTGTSKRAKGAKNYKNQISWVKPEIKDKENVERALIEMTNAVDRDDFDKEKMIMRIKYAIEHGRQTFVSKLLREGVSIRFQCKICALEKYLYDYQIESRNTLGHLTKCTECEFGGKADEADDAEIEKDSDGIQNKLLKEVDEVEAPDFKKDRMRVKIKYAISRGRTRLIKKIQREGVATKFQCKTCQENKYLYDYKIHLTTSSGHRLSCAACERARTKEKYNGDIPNKDAIQQRLLAQVGAIENPDFNKEKMATKIKYAIANGRNQLIHKIEREGVDTTFQCKTCGLNKYLYDFKTRLTNFHGHRNSCSSCEVAAEEAKKLFQP